MSGTAPDAEVSVRIDGQTYGGKSALAVIAHPYYRQSVVLALSYVIRGVQFGFAGWFVCLILFRQALKRRRERALQDRVIAGTLVTTEQIGRAHVSTPVTNALIVCRLLLHKQHPIPSADH